MKHRILTIILMLLSLPAMAQKHKAKPKPPTPPPMVVQVGGPLTLQPPFNYRSSFNVVDLNKKTRKWSTTKVDYYIHSSDTSSSILVAKDIVVDFFPARPITLVAKVVDGDMIVDLIKADSTNGRSCRFDISALPVGRTFAICLCDDSWYCIDRILFECAKARGTEAGD